MLSEIGLPMRIGILVLVLACGFTARMGWSYVVGGEETGRIEVFRASNADEASESDPSAAEDQEDIVTSSARADEDQYSTDKGTETQYSGEDGLMNAGGSTSGPVPAMSDGTCPVEFPVLGANGCYAE